MPSLEYNDNWAESDDYFIYILHLDEDGLYVGHTGHFDERMKQHKYNYTKGTAGRSPQVIWKKRVQPDRFTTALAEIGLKYLVTQNGWAVFDQLLKYDKDDSIPMESEVHSFETPDHWGPSVKERVYRTLREQGKPMTVDALAEHLVVSRNGIAVMFNRDQNSQKPRYFTVVGYVGRAELWDIAEHEEQ